MKNANRLNKCRPAVMTQAFMLLALAPCAVFAAASGDKPAAAAPAEMQAQRQANVKTVMAYYEAALKADFEAARKYIGTDYIEHDPERKDGISGLQQAFELEKKKRTRKAASHEIVIADNDLVVLMSQVVSTPVQMAPPAPANTAPGDAPPPPPATSTEGVPVGGPLTGSIIPPQSTIKTQAEIFRLQEGKIVEHWITIQGLGNP